jgi:hypothetical protein
MKMLAKKNIALNMPNTSTAEMFAVRIVLSRKTLSGTIGEVTRASINRKVASRTATATRLPIVRTVPQPPWVASPRVKISRSKPPVSVAAPAVSNGRRRSSPRLSGTIRGASAAAARPIGTLIQKIHSQPGPPASTPPRITPTIDPIPASEPHTPSALLRAGPSAKVLVTIDSAAGVKRRAEAARL